MTAEDPTPRYKDGVNPPAGSFLRKKTEDCHLKVAEDCTVQPRRHPQPSTLKYLSLAFFWLLFQSATGTMIYDVNSAAFRQFLSTKGADKYV
jgi:hypothetical protein